MISRWFFACRRLPPYPRPPAPPRPGSVRAGKVAEHIRTRGPQQPTDLPLHIIARDGLLYIQPPNLRTDMDPEMRSILRRTAQRMRLNRAIPHAVEALLAVVSIAAAYMISLPTGHALQPWGFVVGLCSQPLWIYSAIHARKFGILANAIFYTGAWVQGIRNHF